VIDYQDSTTDLRVEVRNVVDQLNGAGLFTVLNGVVVATTETRVAHGLLAPPRGVFVTPYAGVQVSRSKPPDHKYVYLIATSAVVVDLLVVS
jgi:hypothetical protein